MADGGSVCEATQWSSRPGVADIALLQLRPHRPRRRAVAHAVLEEGLDDLLRTAITR
jgi:hypothetical protein